MLSLQIGSKWPELQGARDWDGLLSPLDGALRGELVRYGKFVRAVYGSFDFDAGAPSYGSCRFPTRSLLRRAGVPGTGYKVTRLLHAASTTSAPGWLSPCSSSYVGYVAVCDDEDEIERLGRRDVVIAYRGITTLSEWADSFRSNLTRLRLPTAVARCCDAGNKEERMLAESGFWSLFFTAPGEAHGSLQQLVLDEVRRVIHEYGGGKCIPPQSIMTFSEWLDSLKSNLTWLKAAVARCYNTDDKEEEEEEEPMVESGFWSLFTAPGEAHSSLQQQVLDEVRRIMHEYGGGGKGGMLPPRSITIIGHSLGGALAVLSAYAITTAAAHQQWSGGAPPMVTALSFGGPRVGNAAFRRTLEASGCKVLRVVNSNDIVTKMPGFLVHNDDCRGEPAKPNDAVRLPRWLVSKEWAYSDVGRELRLSSTPNVVESHDLDCYLKLVAACRD
jgi:hypothetical protein